MHENSVTFQIAPPVDAQIQLIRDRTLQYAPRPDNPSHTHSATARANSQLCHANRTCARPAAERKGCTLASKYSNQWDNLYDEAYSALTHGL